MRTSHASRLGHPRSQSERLEARVSHKQKALFQEAASIYGTSLTDFVIRSAQEAAQRAVQEYEIMRLSARDRSVFVNALLNPPEPSPRLQAAARHYKNVMGAR